VKLNFIYLFIYLFIFFEKTLILIPALFSRWVWCGRESMWESRWQPLTQLSKLIMTWMRKNCEDVANEETNARTVLKDFLASLVNRAQFGAFKKLLSIFCYVYKQNPFFFLLLNCIHFYIWFFCDMLVCV
jgi:hypothetical protein